MIPNVNLAMNMPIKCIPVNLFQDSEEEEEHPQGGSVEAFVSDMGERVMSLEGLEAQLDDDVEEEVREKEEEIQPENIPPEGPSDQQHVQHPPQGNAGYFIYPYCKSNFHSHSKEIKSNM